MGTADFMLFALLTLANACLLVYVRVRRERRSQEQRMMRSLRSAIRRDTVVAVSEPIRELAAA